VAVVAVEAAAGADFVVAVNVVGTDTIVVVNCAAVVD
jgi:hypothetical protein